MLKIVEQQNVGRLQRGRIPNYFKSMEEQNEEPVKEFFSASEAFEEFGVPEPTVRRNINKGFFFDDELKIVESKKKRGVMMTLVHRSGMERLVHNRSNRVEIRDHREERIKKRRSEKINAVAEPFARVAEDAREGFSVAIEVLRETNEELRNDNKRLRSDLEKTREQLFLLQSSSVDGDGEGGANANAPKKTEKTSWSNYDWFLLVIVTLAGTAVAYSFLTF